MCYLVAKDRDAHGYVKGATAMRTLNIPVGVSNFEEIRSNVLWGGANVVVY